MARTRSTQTIADQLDSLVEELKDEVAAEVTPEVIETPAESASEAASEVTQEVTELLGEALDETPQINIVEPAEPEEAPMSATTLAEIEAGRAALARKT